VSNLPNKSNKYISNMHTFDYERVDKLNSQTIEIKTIGDSITKKDYILMKIQQNEPEIDFESWSKHEEARQDVRNDPMNTLMKKLKLVPKKMFKIIPKMDVQSLKYISLLMEVKVDSFDEMLAFLKSEHKTIEKNSI